MKDDAIEIITRFYHDFFLKTIPIFNSLSQRRLVVRDKADGSKVSSVDLEIERLFLEFITKYFPDFYVCSEEMEFKWPPDSGSFMVLDPLDGTHNYLAGFPLYGVMATIVVEKSPYLSLIFLPYEEMISSKGLFTATSGWGAWRWHLGKPESRIYISGQSCLENSFLLLEGSGRDLNSSPLIQKIISRTARSRKALSMAWSVTRLAAASLFPNGIDVLICVNNKITDNIHAPLFAQEAGGICTDFNGNTVTLNCKNLILTNNSLHASIMSRI